MSLDRFPQPIRHPGLVPGSTAPLENGVVSSRFLAARWTPKYVRNDGLGREVHDQHKRPYAITHWQAAVFRGNVVKPKTHAGLCHPPTRQPQSFLTFHLDPNHAGFGSNPPRVAV
jgi:hypothetical protein